MASVANINDVVEGHVALEVECVDRLLLNAYVPSLQVGGQVFAVYHRASGQADRLGRGAGQHRQPVPA
jgi:hypothetical protein